MVLYIGYPVSYETACTLFCLPEGALNIDMEIKKTGLEFYSIDKGQYIMGLKVDEIADLWETFVSVDDALILILKKKKEVIELIQKAGIDLSDFLLERMESEPLRVHNPPPYLITA